MRSSKEIFKTVLEPLWYGRAHSLRVMTKELKWSQTEKRFNRTDGESYYMLFLRLQSWSYYMYPLFLFLQLSLTVCSSFVRLSSSKAGALVVAGTGFDSQIQARCSALYLASMFANHVPGIATSRGQLNQLKTPSTGASGCRADKPIDAFNTRPGSVGSTLAATKTGPYAGECYWESLVAPSNRRAELPGSPRLERPLVSSYQASAVYGFPVRLVYGVISGSVSLPGLSFSGTKRQGKF
ncbi:hypothetical protein RRG08_008266 [Elysia crispata]|uniref:Uncharacterized protein n=1 Tax=Elysia crispata TaxID=231223 RepID=A0AAE0ZM75_9GAST|nr:hypothetical protein RRG08_008266 [Elysia crispata]